MSDEEDYFLPLQDQRVFGAGIRRKRVPFVRSSEYELNTTTASTSATAPQTPDVGTNIASKYLSIVLPKDARPATTAPSEQDQEQKQDQEQTRSASAPPSSTCEVCNLPIPQNKPPASVPPEEEGEGEEGPSNDRDRPHEASLAHQLCLAHSHPPSHLDRSRPGLRYLSAYGWDPDRRVGLGVPGREGIREPVKGRMKADTVGLGVDVEELDRRRQRQKDAGERGAGRDKVQKLNARQVRKAHGEDRRKGERLREMFYRSEDLQRYLGGGGGGGGL